MYQLAIFDLDGTLLNTIEDLSHACNVALDAFGYKGHDLETYKTYVGNGIYKLVERALPEGHTEEENVLKVKAVFDTYYKAHSEDYTKPYEGIVTLLENLKEAGILCGVVTNKAHDYATALMTRQFGHLINYTLGQREGVPTKPNPVGVLELLQHFGIEKEKAIYIGDSNVDILTAQNAGLTSVGVLWGFRGEAELKAAGASYLVSDTRELEKLIKKDRP